MKIRTQSGQLVDITGKVTTTVRLPDGTSAQVTVGTDGRWSLPISPLTTGSQVTVTQQETGKLVSPQVTSTVVVSPVDTDGDGTPDELDTDDDNDGVLDTQEERSGQAGTSTNTSTSATKQTEAKALPNTGQADDPYLLALLTLLGGIALAMKTKRKED